MNCLLVILSRQVVLDAGLVINLRSLVYLAQFVQNHVANITSIVS